MSSMYVFRTLLVTGVLAALCIAVLVGTNSASIPTGACESLTSLELPDTTIGMAQRVPAGTFVLARPFPAAGPRGGLPVVAAEDVPEFCRVVGVIEPSKDSHINVEVWLPSSNWNGNFLGVGKACRRACGRRTRREAGANGDAAAVAAATRHPRANVPDLWLVHERPHATHQSGELGATTRQRSVTSA